jgi:mono/diheme cytochrome c family protein
MDFRMRKILVLTLGIAMLLVGYTNCSGFATNGSLSSSGLNLGQQSVDTFCAQDLKAKFNTSYRTVLNANGLCIGCHSEGGASPIKFATQDLSSSFSVFMGVGADRVDQNAVSTTHASPITGPQLQARIVAARAVWDPAYTAYQKCLSGGAGGRTPDALAMDAKNITDLYFGDGRTVTVSWLLSSEVVPISARFPAIFSVDIRVTYDTVDMDKIPTGYAFSKPRLQMLTGEQEVEVEGVIVRVNDAQAVGSEPFLSARNTARGVDPKNIFDDEVKSPLAVISSADKISFAFGYFSLRQRTDNPPTPPAATLAAKNPYTKVAQVPINIGNDTTARRWCLTSSPTKPTSTANPCPGFEGKATDGWLLARPANFDLTTLGRAPASGEAVPFYLWIANADLKISATAAQAQVTFDSTPPAAPALGSVTLGATQIADLVGLADSSEPISWCVKEAAAQMDAENANGCSFSATKPSYVGLSGTGTRYVVVHVQDRAGNNSKSPTRTVNNTYGRISYEQLASTATGARGVFANRCASCHGTGGVSNAKWDLTSYAATVAKKDTILMRIDNTAQPMPPTGLLDERERALIRLWLTQTATPVQQ